MAPKFQTQSKADQASKALEVQMGGVKKPRRIRHLTYEAAQRRKQLHQLQNPDPPLDSPTQQSIKCANPSQLKDKFKRMRMLADIPAVNHFAHHGCSNCTTAGEKCACGRTLCDLCKGECINCNLKNKTTNMSRSDAIIYVTEFVRALLLQAYVLKGGAISTAPPILKNKYAQIMVKLHFCFEILKSLGVAL